MARQIEIVAEFRKERQFFQNDDSRVIIGEAIHECDAISEENEFGEQWQSAPTITIKGEAEDRQLRQGLTYRFYGHWFEHHRYGRQFAFTAFILEEPATENAVVCYLQLCRGIGPGTAQRMFDLYGSDAIKTLREDPERVAAEVKSMTPEKAAEASRRLKSMQGTERAKAEMMGLLDGRGFPKKTVQLCIDDYGSAASAVIRRNPYLLMQYRGCGFLKTDKMYLELGLPPDRLKRQALCAWHAIARDSEGHTWFPASVATGAISRTVSGARLNPERAAELAVRAKYLTRRIDANGCVWIAEHAKAYAEERIVNAIEAAALETPAWPDLSHLDGLTDHQIAELQKCLGGVIGILAGAPGTGKTYTAAKIIKAIIAAIGTEKVAAVAPTGKAAVRLTESLQANDISLQATTIHRLLVVESQRGGFSFKFRENNPLPHKFVLIDESSMIDANLMSSLLAARGAGTHFLFLGDTNQLAPVGHGAPLRDMIAAGLPAGDLREIRRNSGRIVQACADIRDRRRFIPSPEMDLDNGENLLHVETSGATGTLETLQRFYTSIENSDEYDPIWSVQVLCAVNKKSPLGRRELNSMLQGMLNPMGKQASGNRFRVGDKIINLKNGWFSAVDPKHPDCNQQGKLYVANGEIGEAVEVEPRRTICRLSDPPRLVVIPHGSPKGGGSEDTGSENEDDRVGKDNAKDDDDTGTGSTWDLAYAISTHKSQGSEFPVAIVILDEHSGAQRVCTRNWLFTAISRAKKICVTIGPQRLAQAMCQKDGLRRKTFLVERIHDRPGIVFGKSFGNQVQPVQPVQVQRQVAAAAAITDDRFRALFAGAK